MALAALERLTTIEEPGVNLSAPGSDTVMCEGGTVMTTLAVLAALVAAPVLFCVLLAVALAGVMALHFGRGLISPSPHDRGVLGADVRSVRRQGDDSDVRSLPGPSACCAGVGSDPARRRPTGLGKGKQPAESGACHRTHTPLSYFLRETRLHSLPPSARKHSEFASIRLGARRSVRFARRVGRLRVDAVEKGF